MNTSRKFFTLAFTFTATCLLGMAASVKAQTVITSLPYTITTAGTYVLNSNLSSTQTSGNLITINASNVTIDFQSHYISGPVGNTSQSTFGICAYERSNLTIKNGTVAYCDYGIVIGGSDGASTNSVNLQIDNMRLTFCYYIGILIYDCLASRITNCQVSECGYSGASNADGISASGSGIVVQDNVITTITANTSVGISIGTGAFARRNVISNAGYGVYGGKYQDNLSSGCTTPFSAGTDAGGNN